MRSSVAKVDNSPVRIAYVGPFHVDRESAGLSRVIGNALCMAASGHEVTIIGQSDAVHRRVAAERVMVEGRPAPTSKFARAASGQGVVRTLDEVACDAKVVMAYGGSGPFTRAVRRWSERRQVPRIIDSVEWYEPSQLESNRFGPRFLDNEYSMRVRYPRADGVMAISRLLEDHYVGKGVSTLRVPPLLDVKSSRVGSKADHGPLRLVYAGNPGRKDDLATIVRAIRSVNGAGRRVVLDLFGPAADSALLADLGLADPTNVGVVLHGRAQRAAVLEAVAAADYVPLLRPDLRFAHAGFPTKVAEAMAVGTAVLANLTSDLKDHVLNHETGLVVADSSIDAMASALESAVLGGHELAASLGQRARNHAENSFDFRAHRDRIDAWLMKIVT